MAQITVSIGVKVEPWVERYTRMVVERAKRTGERPLMDIVQRVMSRGVRPYVVQ